MDAELASKSQGPRARGRIREAGSVVEVGPNGVDGRLETGGPRGDDHLGSGPDEFLFVWRPDRSCVSGEIGCAERQALDSLSGPGDLVDGGKARRGFNNGDQVHLAGTQPTLALKVLEQPIRGLELPRVRHFRQQD